MSKEIERIISEVKELWPEVEAVLKDKYPEYLQLYRSRYEYVVGQYPDAMRLHNAYEILRLAAQLGISRLRRDEFIRVRVPAELKRKLEEIAGKQNKTLSQVVREALAEYVSKYGGG